MLLKFKLNRHSFFVSEFALLPTKGHHSEWRLSAGNHHLARLYILTNASSILPLLPDLHFRSPKKSSLILIYDQDHATNQHHSSFPLETCPHVPHKAFKQFHTIEPSMKLVCYMNCSGKPMSQIFFRF